MDTNLSDLKYFIKTVEFQNISKAAIELGIRQPSLSLAIKRLEENLESNLFIRSKKGVSLTKEGKILYRRAVEIVELWEITQSDVAGIKYSVAGNLRFGCHSSVGLYTLKYFLPRFLKDYPQVNIHIEHDLSRIIMEKVINSELDIGLVINPSDHPDIIKIKILDDEVCLWANKKNAMNASDLTLLCDPDLVQSKEILRALKKSKLKVKRAIHSGDLENIVNLVHSGVGIGILPGRVVGESGKKLVKLNQTPIFKDELYLVFRYEQKSLKLLEEFKRYILENIG